MSRQRGTKRGLKTRDLLSGVAGRDRAAYYGAGGSDKVARNGGSRVWTAPLKPAVVSRSACRGRFDADHDD